MSRRAIRRMRRTVQRITGPFRSRALILLYHRVVNLPTDPWGLAVSPRHFEEHLEVLRQKTELLSLQHLIERVDAGDTPRLAVAVTFDDGYVDNLVNAKPALEQHEIPATIFITSGTIGRDREFWWDELDRLLLQAGTLPETFDLSINGRWHHWELGDAARYDEGRAASHRSWRAWEPPPTPRHRLFLSLWELLQPLPNDEQSKVLGELSDLAGAGLAGRPTHRAVSTQEAIALADGDLIDVGAHTVTHPMLAALPVAAQRDELLGSKRSLEDLLGRSVTGFAYPYGGPTEYSRETVAIAREAGFAYACSNVEGFVRRSSDRFQLPRFQVHDGDGDEFAANLAHWWV